MRLELVASNGGNHQSPTQRTSPYRRLEPIRRTSPTINVKNNTPPALAAMVHELQSPMQGILGMGHLIRKDGVTQQQEKYLQGVEAIVKHLLGVINNALHLSKAEAGKVLLESDNVSIESLWEFISNNIAERVQQKGIKLTLETDILATEFIGHPQQLTQSLLNYLTNAIKFTPQGGQITVRIHNQEENGSIVLTRFEVQDTGQGIPEETLSRLFTPFEQADNLHGGTGLGLSIVKQLATLMGGEVGAESIPGHGSTFWFTAQMMKKEKSRPVHKNRVAGFDDLINNLQQHYRGKSILVVDDEPMNREIAKMFFEEAGLVVDEAENGAVAIEKVQHSTYIAILMDMQMPKICGLDATRQIRGMNIQTPIIIATGNGSSEDRDLCFNAGANDVLVKPYMPEQLFLSLQSQLNRTIEDLCAMA